MRILFASSEVFPLVKTGGLADVSAALPAALAELGQDVVILLPAYPEAVAAAGVKDLPVSLGSAFGDRAASLLPGRLPGTNIRVLLVDAPNLFDRPGGPYQDEMGKDWPDNHKRFGILSWAAARLGQEPALIDWKPDVLHLNDWQTGLAPAYLESWGGSRPATVFTIHNIAYQGNFPAASRSELELAERCYSIDGLEYFDQLSFMKAGLYYSDRITTVSPTYAREIQHAPQGCGFEGLLSARADVLSGILNGADYTIWDPRNDPHLPARHDPGDFEAKARDKSDAQRTLGLSVDPHAPLFVVVSRLAGQKGMDLVLAAIPTLLRLGGQLAVLGTGDRIAEAQFTEAARSHAGSIGVHIGYSEPLAHRLIAGGDFLLMPSRAEPCGLTQMYALRYGTLPIVHRIGGLADSVVDASFDANLAGEATGFVMDEPTASCVEWCISRAAGAFIRTDELERMRQAAIRQDFSWSSVARRYLDLYRAIRPNE